MAFRLLPRPLKPVHRLLAVAVAAGILATAAWATLGRAQADPLRLAAFPVAFVALIGLIHHAAHLAARRLLPLLDFLERDRVHILSGFWIVVGASFGRILGEHAILTDGLGVAGTSGSLFLQSYWQWAHNLSFFIAALVGGFALVSFVSRNPPRKVFNALVWASPFVVMPPIIDGLGLFTGRPVHDPLAYSYTQLDVFLFNTLTFFTGSTAAPGIQFEVLLVLVLLVVYVGLRTGSILRTLLTFAIVYLFAALLGSATASVLESETLAPATAFNTANLSYYLVFFATTAAAGCWIVRRSSPRAAAYLGRLAMQPFVLVALGVAFVGAALAGFPAQPWYVAVPYLLLILLTAFLAATATLLLRGFLIHRRRGFERAPLNRSQYFHALAVHLAIAVGTASLLGPVSLLAVLVAVPVAGFVMGSPYPQTARRLAAGVGLAGVLLLAFFPVFQPYPDQEADPFTPGYERDTLLAAPGMVEFGPYFLQFPLSRTAAGPEVAVAALGAVAAGFALGPQPRVRKVPHEERAGG